MNSLDRISLTLKIQPADRVPVITFTDIKNNNMSSWLTNYILNNADAEFEFTISELSYLTFPCVGIDINTEETKKPNGWIELKYTTKNKDVFTEIYKYSEKGLYRGFKKHIISKPKDIYIILNIPYIGPEKNKDFIREVENSCINAKNHTGKNEFSIFIINNPLSFLASNTNPEDISIWTLTERSLIKEYLGEILRRQLEYIEYILKNCNIPAIFMIGGAEFAIPPLMSPKDFDEFVFEYDKDIIKLLHKYEKLVIVHCHGKINDFIPKFIDMGSNGLHPLEPVGATGDCDLKVLKKKYGDKICLIGNMQYEVFANGSPEFIDNYVKTLMGIAKESGGFILSPACPLFHSQMPEKIENNIKAFIDSGLKYGKY